MQTWSNILFYAVFLSQILLLSYYFPRKILLRMKSVIENYPPSEYPKLYPKPIEYYLKGQWKYKLFSQIIMGLGFVILFAIIFVVDHSSFADDGYISEAWPAGFGLLQFLPLMFLELSEFGQFKEMRKANTATTRTAQLQRRRLFDYVSPWLVVSTVAVALFYIIFDFYAHDFVVQWGHDTVERIAVLVITNLFLVALASWHLYGRKLDPHQSQEDRTKQLTAMVKSFLFLSMAMSIFFTTVAADDIWNLDFLDAILMSVYFQALIFLTLGHNLHSLKLEGIDFDVYKNNGAVT